MARTTARKSDLETDPKLETVEVEANGGGASHTVMLENHRIDFVDGKATVTVELAQKLREANQIK